MSDTSIVDTSPNLSNPQVPAAPPSGGDTQGSAPASVDVTASEPAKPQGQEPKQSRSESRRQANQRREIRDLHREIGYMRAQLEAVRPPAQQDDQGQPAGQDRPSPAEAATQRRQAEKARIALERLEDAGDEIEGFDAVLEKITARNFPITEPMVDFLVESDKAPQVAAWLADHPEEALRISMMSEWRADRALEKVAASLTTKPAPRTTNAPPPPPTVNGRGTPQFDGKSANMDDYGDYWRERRAKAGYR